MVSSSSTSLLMLLSRYTSLRRSGVREPEALNKLRDLVQQLSPPDRRELIKGIQNWETSYGQKVDLNATDASARHATLVITPDAAQIYGTSEYDQVSSLTQATALRPLHEIVICRRCGKQNETSKPTCASCGKPLAQPDATGLRATASPNAHGGDLTWFGPESRLVLTFATSPLPLEMPMQNAVTLGRHTPDNTAADIDLTPYGANPLGVSRLHASIARNNRTLILMDIGSTYHTFVNDRQLQDHTAHPLKHGDSVRFGGLATTVTFKHAL